MTVAELARRVEALEDAVRQSREQSGGAAG
jgi:hypothetical protein